MATRTVTRPKRDTRQEAHEALAAAFVAALEEGLADPQGWVPPWHQDGFLGGAVNASTSKRYHGGNAWRLGLIEAAGLHSGPWATFKQWQALGAQVRKGEKGTMILAPRPVEVEDKKTGETRKIVLFRAFTVFGANQVDGWTPPEVADRAPEGERVALFEEWLTRWESVADVRYARQAKAYFSPSADYVSLPEVDCFKSHAGRVATVTHEAGHWTGHESRLGRFGSGPTDKAEYGREELVAELTSALMGQHFGLTGPGELTDDHRDYLANWLQAIREDASVVWEAATKASKAQAYLLAVGE